MAKHAMNVAIENRKTGGVIGLLKTYEYELVLFLYLSVRFVFKNILGVTGYFTAEPVFGFSNAMSVVTGLILVVFVCASLSMLFGQLIRKNGKEHETPLLLLTALFFAAPVTLPFLFGANTHAFTSDTISLSGTTMLYPFALFISVFLVMNKPYIRWVVPLICALFITPPTGLLASGFDFLPRMSVLYAPLILMVLFINCFNKYLLFKAMRSTNRNASNRKPKTASPSDFWESLAVLILSLLFSVASFAYAVTTRNFILLESLYGMPQNVDRYLLVSLLMTAPALATTLWVTVSATKKGFASEWVFIFLSLQVVLFPLFRDNYYGLWVPFLVLSFFLFLFICIYHGNSAVLSAAKIFGDYCGKHKFLLLFLLIAMASFSNTSMIYSSSFLFNVFGRLPY